MKKISIYSLFTAFFLFISLLLFSSFNKSLENYLVGEWTESRWEYKAADNYLLKGLGLEDNTLVQAHNVRVHTGETWVFKPKGALEIHVADSVNLLSWSLKGRGNILEISDGFVTEHFDIKKYDNRQMELHFITDIQVKESARLIFTQTKKG